MFGRNNSAGFYSALIDIESGSIGIGIARHPEGAELPELVFADRILIRAPKDTLESEAYFAAVGAALEAAGKMIDGEGMRALRASDPYGVIGHVAIAATAPWSRTLTRRISHREKEPFKVTESMLRDLTEESADALANEQKEIEAAKQFGFDVILREIVTTEINGYPVDDPLDHKGTSIEFVQVSSLMSETVVKMSEEIFERILPRADRSYYAYPTCSFAVLRECYREHRSFTMLQIGEEATEIGIIEDHVLTFSTFIPYGGNTLLRTLDTDRGASKGETRTEIRVYYDNTLHESMHERVKDRIGVFTDMLTRACAEIEATHSLPQTLIVSDISGENDPVFEKSISLVWNKGEIYEAKDCLTLPLSAGADIPLVVLARFFHKIREREEQKHG